MSKSPYHLGCDIDERIAAQELIDHDDLFEAAVNDATYIANSFGACGEERRLIAAFRGLRAIAKELQEQQ